MIIKRSSGILFPIFSFTSCDEFDLFIGDFSIIYKTNFIDFIKKLGFSKIQILPINPVDNLSFSPYSSYSAFAGNPYFISIYKLIQDNLISYEQVKSIFYETINKYSIDLKNLALDKVYYNFAFEFKDKILRLTFNNFKNSTLKIKIEFEIDNFIYQNKYWIYDYAIFKYLKKVNNNQSWNNWDLKFREQVDFNQLDKEELDFYIFEQYLFYKQYFEFKEKLNEEGIEIIGDIPIYVSYDSVDVYSNRELFKLDNEGNMVVVAGVPPDYFSETGQLWGNPIYNWDLLAKTGFKWWIRRLLHSFKVYDLVRIDHFRGLVAFWEVPAYEKTAINGKWVNAKPYELFNTLLNYKSVLPIIAEDLGVITEDVELFRQHFYIPTMRVLQFAWDNIDTNPHIPHNYPSNAVVYTATHDNNTTKGWFLSEAKDYQKELINKYLAKDINENNVSIEFIKLLISSNANLTIIPVFDLLNLDQNFRINKPGTIQNNWIYRDNLFFNMNNDYKNYIYELNKIYNRL
ncbi:MAG: 4-alpha-glucanotransferase [bacterium]